MKSMKLDEVRQVSAFHDCKAVFNTLVDEIVRLDKELVKLRRMLREREEGVSNAG